MKSHYTAVEMTEETSTVMIEMEETVLRVDASGNSFAAREVPRLSGW